jgi:cell division protein ZapB
LLTTQLGAVTSERDNLRSRLNAARGRIDVLLQRLPCEPVLPADGSATDGNDGAPLRSVG